MHANVPQNDQDECQEALSTVEDGDPCYEGMQSLSVSMATGLYFKIKYMLGSLLQNLPKLIEPS